MFTGIIEATGRVSDHQISGTNHVFWIESKLSKELKPDQSVSHNGVCLTVEEIKNELYRVTAIDETIKKTNLSNWSSGTQVNLERCLMMNGRLDGHLVQGHVDATAVCTSITEKNGSWEFSFEFDSEFAKLMIEKGSIAINGISLTVFNVTNNTFCVAIIPYTYEHTNINQLKISDRVNIEFDMMGKYINRILSIKDK